MLWLWSSVCGAQEGLNSDSPQPASLTTGARSALRDLMAPTLMSGSHPSPWKAIKTRRHHPQAFTGRPAEALRAQLGPKEEQPSSHSCCRTLFPVVGHTESLHLLHHLIMRFFWGMQSFSSEDPCRTPPRLASYLHCVPVNLSTKELCSAARDLEEFPGRSTSCLEREVWSINQCTLGHPRPFCPQGLRLPLAVGALEYFPCCPSRELCPLLGYVSLRGWLVISRGTVPLSWCEGAEH